MFGHLDLNTDGYLSMQELYDLEHDKNERCIKPFIDTCDLDQDKTISPREWCRCFEKTDRPCAAVRRRIGSDLLGEWNVFWECYWIKKLNCGFIDCRNICPRLWHTGFLQTDTVPHVGRRLLVRWQTWCGIREHTHKE